MTPPKVPIVPHLESVTYRYQMYQNRPTPPPPPNLKSVAWIYGHVAFGQKLGNVLIGQGISEVSADAKNNHLARELATFEWIGRSDWHGLLPYQTPAQTSQRNPRV
jgi:hypothetical protein